MGIYFISNYNISLNNCDASVWNHPNLVNSVDTDGLVLK